MILAGALVMASALLWALVLVFLAPGAEAGAAALLAGDLLVASTVTVAGLVIGRSRWAQRLGLLLVAAPLVLLGVSPSRWLLWAAAVASAAALVALLRPRVRSRLGMLRTMDAPPPIAVVVALALLLLPGWTAAVSSRGLPTGLWALSAATLVLAWAYGRALVWSVPVLRLALLPGAVLAVLGSPTLTAVAVLGYAVALTVLAWTRPAKRAAERAQPLPGTVIPLPAHAVPADVRAALRDDS